MSRIHGKDLGEYPWWLRVFYFFQKKKYGTPLEPTLVWGRRPKLLKAFLKSFQVLERKDSPLSPKLRAAVMVRISQINECTFCIDMNGYTLMERSGNLNTVEEIPHFRQRSTSTKL